MPNKTEKKAQHTPGLIMVNPWMAIDRAEAEDNVKAAREAGDLEVLALPYELIAGSRDLLREAQSALVLLEAVGWEDNPTTVKLRAALAKASGEGA